MRPIIPLPYDAWDNAAEGLGIAGLLAGFILAQVYQPLLPVRIPVHFGANGLPDGWGPKSTLFFLPCIALGMYLLMTLVSRIPHRFNYPYPITVQNVPRQYRLSRRMLLWLRTYIIWLFAYLNWSTTQVALGNAAGLGNWFWVTLLPPFIFLAGYVIKAKEAQ